MSYKGVPFVPPAIAITTLGTPGPVTLQVEATVINPPSAPEVCMVDFPFAIVGPACDTPNPTVTPSYVQIPGPPDCLGDLGRTAVQTNSLISNVTACVDQQLNWNIRVESIVSQYSMEICPQGQVVIDSAFDTDITAATYCIALDDFTPAGVTPAAPYSFFFPSQCILVHEQTHVQEWKNTFNQGWTQGYADIGLPPLEDIIENLSILVSSQNDTPQAAIIALQTDINDAMIAFMDIAIHQRWPFDPPAVNQTNAYVDENSCLTILRQAILNRAVVEGWAPCQP